MGKKIIRLTETDFINMVKESVCQIIKENEVGIQLEGNLQDVIDGLNENGTDIQYVNSENGGSVNFEIKGISGIIYFVDVIIDFSYDYTPSTYYDDEIVDTNEEIVDVEISYYDDYNERHEVEYIKNEEFETTLLEYIEVDYSDYDEDNHYQYPDEDR